MPTNPTTPGSSPAVDRLTLGVESPRGTPEASMAFPCLPQCSCFEAEASGISLCLTSGATCVCSEAQ